MPLNENEERILAEIERRFYASDPHSARRISRTTLLRYLARNTKWAALGFVVGLAVLLFGFGTNWIVGVLGFVIMLVSTVVLIQNVRKMGRHGMRQLSQSMRAREMNQAIDDAVKRIRRRFGGDSD